LNLSFNVYPWNKNVIIFRIFGKTSSKIIFQIESN